ncbi:MAG TPA: hypothetical protein VFW71_14220 [Actinomycetota bacterium]|nr:hypothetical protein [Actinomycetota bacterium]
MTTQPPAAGSVRAFDLGPPPGVDGDFALAGADWAGALRLAGTEPADGTWAEIYAERVVPLASGVVHAATQMEVYLPRLDQILRRLGAQPSDGELGTQAEGVIGVLRSTAVTQHEACARAAATVGELAGCLQEAAGSAVPGDLVEAVSRLGGGWARLEAVLGALRVFVDEHARQHRSFRVKLDVDETLERWDEARAAAERWRVEAFVR